VNIPSVHKIFGTIKDPAPNPLRAVIALGSWLRRDGKLAHGIWSEFLPVRGRPVIDYIMDELRASGFAHIDCVFYLESDKLTCGTQFRDEEIIADWNLRARDIAYRHKRSFAGLGTINFRAPLTDLSLEAALLRVADENPQAPFLLVFPEYVSPQGATNLSRLLEAYRVYGVSVMNCHCPKPEVIETSDWRIRFFEAALSGAPHQVCNVLPVDEQASVGHDTSLREGCFAGRLVVSEALVSKLMNRRNKPDNSCEDLRSAMQELSDKGLLLAQPIEGNLYNCASVDGLLAANSAPVASPEQMFEKSTAIRLFEYRTRKQNQ